MISPNQDDRPAGVPIDHLVLHYTGMKDAPAAIGRLCDPAAKVSAHYVIETDGRIHALVPEARRAWHAGVSYWRGVRGLNDRSVGLEIVNPGHEFGYVDFPDAQIEAVIGLCREILGRHPIPAWNVVAHSDIAPDRKQDPGELFPWARLAVAGIGLWPDGPGMAGEPLGLLGAIGYDTSFPPAVVIAAFQRRFRPARVDGLLDPATIARIGEVARGYRDQRSGGPGGDSG